MKKTRKAKKPNKAKKPKKYQAFSTAMTNDSYLKSLRQKYADVPADERRMAAQWEYDEEAASDMFKMFLAIVGDEPWKRDNRPAGFLSLAIDPLHAPSLLTVGSLDYQHGFVDEAMELFLTLTTLPEDEEDLDKIIDKAGDFLLDEEDFENALELYLAAERAYPEVAVYPCGAGYCYYELGNTDEMVRKARRAAQLEPDNYIRLNDLGFALLEAGLLDESEMWLRKAVKLAPPEYELARGNLEALAERRRALCQSHV
ncbi:MAG: tetratricopeptide repeat protein [Desulfomonilaceae bacterium]|nr:tetratricopeptide repeat protein [Desulfomonilaceae bacterium]